LGGEITDSYNDFISFSFPINDPDDGENGETVVEIQNAEYYDPNLPDDLDGEDCSYVSISVETPFGIKKQGQNSKVKEIVYEVLSTIIKCLSKKDQEKCHGVFTYLQYPEKSGDGWNTGDPMGDYQNIPELFSKEVVSGEILIEKEDISIKWNIPQAFLEDLGEIKSGPHRKLGSNKKV